MDIIETVLMFLYKLSKTKLMTKGAKLASAASADALPQVSLVIILNKSRGLECC